MAGLSSRTEQLMGQPINDDDTQLSPAIVAKLTWRLLPLLCLGLGIGHLDRFNISYAELTMGAELGLTRIDYALATGIFFLTYASLQVPSAYVAERFGVKQVLGWSLVAQGVVAIAQALVRSGTSLCLLRLLLGVPEATYFPGAALYISRFFPEAHRARAAAIFQSWAGVGTLLGALSAGPIMQATDGLGGASGWRWLFVTQGVPSILLGLLTLLLLPTTPAAATFLTDAERAELQRHLEASDRTSTSSLTAATNNATKPPASLLANLLAVSRLGMTACFACVHFSMCTLAYMVGFFLPTMIKELCPRWSLTAVGAAGAVPTALSLVAAPAVAALTERRLARQRRRLQADSWRCSLSRGDSGAGDGGGGGGGGDSGAGGGGGDGGGGGGIVGWRLRLSATLACDGGAAALVLGAGLCMYAASRRVGAHWHEWSVASLVLISLAYPTMLSGNATWPALNPRLSAVPQRASTVPQRASCPGRSASPPTWLFVVLTHCCSALPGQRRGRSGRCTTPCSRRSYAACRSPPSTPSATSADSYAALLELKA